VNSSNFTQIGNRNIRNIFVNSSGNRIIPALKLTATKYHNNNSAKKSDLNFSEPTLSLSPNDPIFRRKILPIEPNSEPQSLITLLKSAPIFLVLMFKKPKSESMPTPISLFPIKLFGKFLLCIFTK